MSGKVRTFNPYVLLIVLSLGFIMAVLDTTGVVLAIPKIEQGLTVSLNESLWILNGYILALSTFILLSGNLSTKYGAKRTLLSGMGLFVIASLACSLANSVLLLIVFRFLQGLGAALFMPSSMSVLYRVFPDKKELAKVIGIWSTIISVATGTGSFIGGTIIQLFGWRGVFLINVPTGLITWLVVSFGVQEGDRNPNLKINGLGNISLIGMIASLVIFLVEGNKFGYGQLVILLFLVLFIVIGMIFFISEKRSNNPIFPIKLMSKAGFTVTNTLGFLTNVSLYGLVLVLGLYFQQYLHLSSMISGLLILPGMTVLVIGNIYYTRVSGKYLSNKLALGSLWLTLVGALALFLISFWIQPVPLWLIIVCFAVMSIGIGVLVPASTTILMITSGNEYASMAGATLNANKQLGGLFGTTIMGVITASLGTQWIGIISWTFGINVLIYGLGLLLCWYYLAVSKIKLEKLW